MSDDIRKLAPQALWNHFADLNAIPRASKREDAVIGFAKSFGESVGLETTVDHVGNVLIRKPGTESMAGHIPVVMQSHLDMVHQKNAETEFDFASQGIQMFVDGDWVKAKGTTLGADNGIGVAAIMAVLASDDLPHPPIEALFTIDEETGMTGAQGLQPNWLRGKILLNLDTEEDDELTIGCAGGCDVTARAAYSAESIAADNYKAFRITVRGLTGGHSGVDIHLGRGNSNKIMNRILWTASQECSARIVKIDGGGLRNAIPRESVAEFVVPNDNAEQLRELVVTLQNDIQAEYRTTDPELDVSLEAVAASEATEFLNVVPAALQTNLLATAYACPSGIYRMSPDIDGLVQTSNNLARVLVKDGKLEIQCLTRSSVNSERDDLAQAISANFGLMGANVEISGGYPGWTPAPNSTIVAMMSKIYQELFQESPKVAACHAGLECGIIGRHYEGMDMISFGPTIRGAHSPEERVQISSVEKFWKFLLETLQRIPAE